MLLQRHSSAFASPLCAVEPFAQAFVIGVGRPLGVSGAAVAPDENAIQARPPAAHSSAADGWVMSAGTTQASNSSDVTKPSSRADSHSESPFLWAFLAILEALS